jgi:hypothetical protein
MKRRRTAQSAFLSLCILLGLSTFFTGVVVALFASVAPETSTREDARKVDAQARRQHLAPGAPAGGFYEAWVARYNGTGNTYDYGKAVAVDHAGNVYVAGTSFGVGNRKPLRHDQVRLGRAATVGCPL